MKKNKPPDLAFNRQAHDSVHAAVSPADVVLIFLRIVLGVDDQRVRPGDELGQPGLAVRQGARGALAQLPGQTKSFLGAGQFVVRKKNN